MMVTQPTWSDQARKIQCLASYGSVSCNPRGTTASMTLGQSHGFVRSLKSLLRWMKCFARCRSTWTQFGICDPPDRPTVVSGTDQRRSNVLKRTDSVHANELAAPEKLFGWIFVIRANLLQPGAVTATWSFAWTFRFLPSTSMSATMRMWNEEGNS